MSLPSDPIMLLSVVNTRLRDVYSDLETLCEEEGVNTADVIKSLSDIDYHYDSEKRQFV